MKVIKKNKSSNVFPMRIKCKRITDKYGFAYGDEKDFCGSEIEIEAEDIKKHEWFKYPDYEGRDYGVICPVCGKFIVVDTNKIPENILYKAEDIRLDDQSTFSKEK